MRHQTGLRNRYRRGKSSYCTNKKSQTRDKYGKCEIGRQQEADIIAGHALYWHEKPIKKITDEMGIISTHGIKRDELKERKQSTHRERKGNKTSRGH